MTKSRSLISGLPDNARGPRDQSRWAPTREIQAAHLFLLYESAPLLSFSLSPLPSPSFSLCLSLRPSVRAPPTMLDTITQLRSRPGHDTFDAATRISKCLESFATTATTTTRRRRKRWLSDSCFLSYVLLLREEERKRDRFLIRGIVSHVGRCWMS